MIASGDERYGAPKQWHHMNRWCARQRCKAITLEFENCTTFWGNDDVDMRKSSNWSKAKHNISCGAFFPSFVFFSPSLNPKSKSFRVSLESVACCKFHISEHKKYLFKIIIILWLWILFQSLANKILSWWFKLRIIYLLISVVFWPCLFNRNEAKKRHTKFKCDRTQKKMFNTKIAINGPRDIIRPDTNNFCIIA